MSGTILRWGIPAFITVVGGTFAAVTTSGAAIPDDLAARSRAQLSGPVQAWATVSFDGQDATLSGTATTQAMIDDALAEVSEIHGVRTVRSEVVLAENVSPYPFVATVTGGKLRLSGGLPDEAARAEILALAGEGITDDLRLMSGFPDRATWLAAARYVIESAKQLDEGEVALADLSLTVAGRAGTPEAYAELAASTPPRGVERGYTEVQPPLASPYEWHAEFDGTHLDLSGVVPSEALVSELTGLAPAGVEVKSDLQLASGAPSAFDANAQLLLTNLLRLEQGSAGISDAALALDGLPADSTVADTVRAAMTPSRATVTLGAPRVAEYRLTAERTGTGIVLAGFVPDPATRDRLAAMPDVDASALEIARGAPEGFDSAVNFVLQALEKMGEGRASIQGTTLTLEGRARNSGEYAALQSLLEQGAPQGLTLATTSILPPLAKPFTFTAEKLPGGPVKLSGHVPSETLHSEIREAIPTLGADVLTLADGSPADFERSLSGALPLLQMLDSGRLSFDGTGWSLTGGVTQPADALAAQQAFEKTGFRDAGWTYDVTLPKPVPPPAIPVADPYSWRAAKAADGTVAISGFAPTDAFRRYVAAHAGGKVVDSTILGSGAPPDFVANAIAGLDALLQMEQGEIAFSVDTWTLTGKVTTAEDRQSVETSLAAAADISDWVLAIEPVAAPVAAAEPDPVPAAEQPLDETTVASLPAEPEASAAASAPADTEVAPALPPAAVVPPSVPEVPEVVAELAAPPVTPPAMPAVLEYRFDAKKALDASIALQGAVPAEDVRVQLAALTGASPDEGLVLDSSLPPDFSANAEAGARALMLLADGEYGLAGERWVLTGRAETEVERQAALSALAGATGAANWATDVTLLPPMLVCERRVESFQTRNAILFESGSARIADSSGPAIDELASYLAICPDATISVEGHTDADGDADANLALSVFRAEAVVDALVARGVAPERLYAVGYGESLPIASNETVVGKKANRRIAFALSQD